MAQRISNLKPGQTVTLLFRGSKVLGNAPYSDEVIFQGITGTGEDQRATFLDENGENPWEAYRYEGRWSYGSSAERLSVV